MTSIIPVLCLACKRLDVGTERCDAFPAGIPSDILGGADHRKSRPGDGGKAFLLKRTPEGKQAFHDWSLVFGDTQAVSR